MARISKDEYYLAIAQTVALRSTCLRRQYGAVIVKNDRIISTGYNGSARGEENCCDVGECWREAHGIPHGEQYEKCAAVHAEDNAISQAGRESIGATLYLAGFEDGKPIEAKPCLMCERKIKNAQISKSVLDAPGWYAVIHYEHRADAAEAAHGRWRKFRRWCRELQIDDGFTAGCCGGWSKVKTAYCPNCGTKMDGGGDNG